MMSLKHQHFIGRKVHLEYFNGSEKAVVEPLAAQHLNNDLGVTRTASNVNAAKRYMTVTDATNLWIRRLYRL